MNKKLELLTKVDLENAILHVQYALDILNFDKLKLTELCNEGEGLTLTLELIRLDLQEFILKLKK